MIRNFLMRIKWIKTYEADDVWEIMNLFDTITERI